MSDTQNLTYYRKTVQQLPASVAFTMDVYSHIIEGMQEDAMALLDEVLPPGKNEAKNKINAKLTPIL